MALPLTAFAEIIDAGDRIISIRAVRQRTLFRRYVSGDYHEQAKKPEIAFQFAMQYAVQAGQID